MYILDVIANIACSPDYTSTKTVVYKQIAINSPGVIIRIIQY